MAETFKKRASLTPKLLQGHLSNVKDSFYLIDNTVLSGIQTQAFINQHIELLMNSKLYGEVIVLGFRPPI